MVFPHNILKLTKFNAEGTICRTWWNSPTLLLLFNLLFGADVLKGPVSVFIGSFGGRGMEERGFCVVSQRPREKTNHVKRSMHFDRDECLICLIDCKWHYHITHAPSTTRDTGYWTLSLLYFRYCHNALHCTHIPSNFLCIK